MITPEMNALKKEQDTEKFLGELARLVHQYRTEIPLGYILGVFETAKMRLWYEANAIHENAREQEGQE
jgi:hypothetical protein